MQHWRNPLSPFCPSPRLTWCRAAVRVTARAWPTSTSPPAVADTCACVPRGSRVTSATRTRTNVCRLRARPESASTPSGGTDASVLQGWEVRVDETEMESVPEIHVGIPVTVSPFVWQVSRVWKISTSVKEIPVSLECSASTALAPTAVVPALKACWEMGRNVWVSDVGHFFSKVCGARTAAPLSTVLTRFTSADTVRHWARHRENQPVHLPYVSVESL